MISISRLGTENPFGLVTEEPAALPPKLEFPQNTVTVGLYAAVRVDPAGKAVQSKIIRDPIPSLAADSRRSFEQRWSFDPALKSAHPSRPGRASDWTCRSRSGRERNRRR